MKFSGFSRVVTIGILSIFFITTVTVIFSFRKKDEWTILLDKNLSQWNTYLSFRHKPGYHGEAPTDETGKPIAPIGYNKDDNGVFSVTLENGEPVLRISGEIYGCLFTKQDFGNYHLKAKIKWGTKKWVPRLDELKDAGIVYNSQGECGVDYWRTWMMGQEFQIQDTCFGDYWTIGPSRMHIAAEKRKDTTTFMYDAGSASQLFAAGGSGVANYCQRSHDYEKPEGEWNEVELICLGDKSLHIVNGHVVMALSGSAYWDGKEEKPLTKGKIQLQSEAAEVFFKDIRIRNIDKIPDAYEKYFK